MQLIDEIEKRLRELSEKIITGDISRFDYLYEVLKITHSNKAKSAGMDFGVYKNLEVGFLGWVTLEGCTIFFSVAKVVKFCGVEGKGYAE